MLLVWLYGMHTFLQNHLYYAKWSSKNSRACGKKKKETRAEPSRTLSLTLRKKREI